MKSIPLLLVALLLANSVPTTSADESPAEKEKSTKKEKSVPPGLKKKESTPPGWQKRGWVPPGHARKEEPPPSDVLITNEPAPDSTSRPTPPRTAQPEMDSKRVESPRGAVIRESLPPTNLVSAPDPNLPAPTPPPVTPADRARLERRLDEQLKRVNAAWLNLKARPELVNTIAAEAGVNPAAITKQLEANERLRGGDLLMANKIAAGSGNSFEDVLATHRQNQDWVTTGETYGVQPNILVDASRRVAGTR